MTDVDLGYAVTLPPARAMAYLRAKGYAISWNWHDIWREAHVESFTVAKAMTLDLLADIRSEVQAALDDGTTLAAFQASLEPRLRARGWWGKDESGAVLGTPYRLATIFRTNLQSAYNRGRYEEMLLNASDRPWWQYRTVGDMRVRPAHRVFESMVFRYDDVFWKTHKPPLGYNCRCRLVALSDDDLHRAGIVVRQGSMQEKPINVGGRERTVTGYADPRTGDVLYTDPGWDYDKLHGFTFYPPELPPIPPTYEQEATIEFERRLAMLAEASGEDPNALRWKLREYAQDMVEGSSPWVRATKAQMVDFAKAGELQQVMDKDMLAGLAGRVASSTGQVALGQSVVGEGYLSKGVDGNMADAFLSLRGHVAIRLKPSVLKGLTGQVDSIVSHERTGVPSVLPRSLFAPDERMLRLPSRGQANESPLLNRSIDETLSPWFVNLTRRMRFEDIDEIVTAEKLPKYVLRLLDKAGIKVRQIEFALREFDDELDF